MQLTNNNTEVVQFKKIHPDAITPTRGTAYSAGFDLYALEETIIVGGAGNFLVRTGIAVQLPEGTYGRIAMRSGLASKQHLTVSGGVIDIDYSGELAVLVSSTKIFDIKSVKIYKAKLNHMMIFNQNNKDAIEICADDVPVDCKLIDHYDKLAIFTGAETHETNRKDVYPVVTPHLYKIKKGERFAQLIIEKCSYASGEEVDRFHRNYIEHKGFGSTGDGLQK